MRRKFAWIEMSSGHSWPPDWSLWLSLQIVVAVVVVVVVIWIVGVGLVVGRT